MAVVAVAIVVLLLAEGIPVNPTLSSGASPARPQSTPASPPPPSGGPSTTAASRPLSPSSKGYASLCLMGGIPQCAIRESRGTAAPLPLAPDPPSSWTNITPASGQPNPIGRWLSAMAYDPASHSVIMFGGYGELGLGPWVFFQDTWSYSAGHWTELIANTSCTATTCPSPRAGAMIAYDAAENGMILFGGYIYTPSYSVIAYSDTWLFAGGRWTNLSASVGTPPSPRSEGAMVWDSYDNYVLLFGGANASFDSFGDTWKFTETWTNISTTVGPDTPEARNGAAIADSPSGYIMLFGGENSGAYLNDNPPQVCYVSTVAAWFYAGQWVNMPTEAAAPSCIAQSPASPASPSPDANVEKEYPPCGRVFAALGWSPPNNRFVLFGGIGWPIQSSSGCTGFQYTILNDSWTYMNQAGGSFFWENATDPGYVGDPSIREEMGYAADFTDKYFEIFGGYPGRGALNDTWRYNELVHAQLSGPTTIDTNASHFTFTIPFTVTGFGGTGVLNYHFSIDGLKNTGNSLTGAGCTPLTNVTGNYSLPYDGVATIDCKPTAKSFNVYRLTLTVFDVGNWSVRNRATANWTFSVLPPQTAILYSEFKGYFYTGLNFDDNFSAFLKVAGEGPVTVSATLGGAPLTFLPQNGARSVWWNAGPVDMGNVAPGSEIQLTAYWGNWTLNATYQVQIINTPFWLLALVDLPGTTHTFTPHGSGRFNKTWSVNDQYSWNIGQAFGFNLPIPLAGGNYSLIPGFTISSGIDSGGNVSLTGTFKFNSSKISIGPASIEITAKISLTGTFALVTEGPNVSGINWVSATAKVSVTGDLSASVPIYGFDIFGIDIGFTLDIELDPSVALTMILTPTTDTSSEIIPGLQVTLSQLFGSFMLPLSVSVSFGIGIASVAIGGTLSIALTLTLVPTLGVGAGWVNGSLFVSATALFWSDQWTLLGPAVIYSWGSAAPVAPEGRAAYVPSYNNGTGTVWKLDSRYYSGSGYDQNVWNPNATGGAAISDIYPYTTVSAVPGYDGGYLYYTDDSPTLPVNEGLGVSALRLNGSTNSLTSVPSPTDPGYLAEGPKAATLASGSQFVAWAALPASEESAAGPTDLALLALHGALYTPANRSWGPVKSFSNWGIVESYSVDASASGGVVLALISPTPLAGPTTPEHLVAFDLTTGAELSNVSVTGLSSILSLRAAAGDAVVRSASGNDSVVQYADGSPVPVTVTVPTNTSVNSESFVTGSNSTLVVLYREPTATLLVLYDVTTSSVIASLPLDQSILEATGLYGEGTYYLFVRSNAGVFGYTENGGTFQNLTAFGIPHLTAFGLVQAGSALLVYTLSTNGNVTQPIVTLSLEEFGATLPAVPGRPSPPAPTPSPPTTIVKTVTTPNTTLYLEYLGAAAAAVALVLAVIAIGTRKRPKTPPNPPEGSSQEGT